VLRVFGVLALLIGLGSIAWGACETLQGRADGASFLLTLARSGTFVLLGAVWLFRRRPGPTHSRALTPVSYAEPDSPVVLEPDLDEEPSLARADLSRMTLAGWVLLALTGLFVVAYSIVVATQLPDVMGAQGNRVQVWLVVGLGLVAAWAFHGLGAWVLRRLGIRRFRRD
jgi:hypothetical protein